MNEKNNSLQPIPGYFVTLDEEEKVNMLKKMIADGGRMGVFYRKEDLIATLVAHNIGKEMHIVHIMVPQSRIVQPNGTKFGIKKCGEEGVLIKKIESFTDAMKEFQVSAGGYKEGGFSTLFFFIIFFRI